MYDSRLALLQSVETERQRIARDLHDSTTQTLTSLVHKTELCTRLLDVDPVRCKLELYNIGKSLRKIIEDTRGLIYDLRPMSFDDIGFDATLDRFIDKFKKNNKILFHYHVEGEPYSFDSVIQITLLRVIQEACNNAIKHADASNIDITLSYRKPSITLTIMDDGKGFDVQEVSHTAKNDNSGFGLSIMRERVYLLSGKLSIKSSPGNGCKIIVSIPNTGYAV
jgi:two-component system sensor histidine kinase DegS